MLWLDLNFTGREFHNKLMMLPLFFSCSAMILFLSELQLTYSGIDILGIALLVLMENKYEVAK